MTRSDLPREARLLEAAGFQRVFRARQRRDGTYFSVSVCANGGALARLGMTVGRKVSPRAVDRNYIKRLIREAFRRERRALVALDVVVRPRRALGRSEGAAAMAELGSLLRGFRA